MEKTQTPRTLVKTGLLDLDINEIVKRSSLRFREITLGLGDTNKCIAYGLERAHYLLIVSTRIKTLPATEI